MDELWGATASANSVAGCLAAYRAGDRWRCLQSQYALPYIRTPLFAMNSDIDMWYSQYVLGVRCVGWPPAPSPPANCSTGEVARMAALRKAWRATFVPLLSSRPGRGAFVDTCIVHEQNVDYCSSQRVANCVG